MWALIAGILVAAGVLLWASAGNERLHSLLAKGEDAQTETETGTEPGQGSGACARIGRRARGRSSDRARAKRSAADALAFDLELAAICLGSGLPTAHALALAARAGGSHSGLDRLARAIQLGERVADGPLAQVSELVEFSGRTGVALAPLLRGLARDLRRSEHRRRQLAAARLGTQLVIPLGVCILPSFVLLGVVPVLITLLGDFSRIFGG